MPDDTPDAVDLRDLEEVRRRVVLPVVQSLVRPDELEEVLVQLEPDPVWPRWAQDAFRSARMSSEPSQGIVGIIVEQGRVEDFEPPPSGPARNLRIRVRARGEWVGLPRLWWVGVGDGALRDPEDFAAEVYDLLQDELAESRFAWGELREGDYELPGPGTDDARGTP